MDILLPVWNEQDCIRRVLEEVQSARIPGRIWVLDDGSQDASIQVAQEMANAMAQLEVVPLPHGGKDLALWDGIRRAEGDWIGIMDADGQYDPTDFCRMTACATEHNLDAVWGIRAARHDRWQRRWMSKAAKYIRRRILGNVAVADAGCGIWIARRTHLLHLANLCRNPKGQLHCHLAELIVAQGGCVGEIPVTHRDRTAGQAKYGLLNRLKPGWQSLLQARRLHKMLQQETGANTPTNRISSQ